MTWIEHKICFESAFISPRNSNIDFPSRSPPPSVLLNRRRWKKSAKWLSKCAKTHHIRLRPFSPSTKRDTTLPQFLRYLITLRKYFCEDYTRKPYPTVSRKKKAEKKIQLWQRNIEKVSFCFLLRLLPTLCIARLFLREKKHNKHPLSILQSTVREPQSEHEKLFCFASAAAENHCEAKRETNVYVNQ